MKLDQNSIVLILVIIFMIWYFFTETETFRQALPKQRRSIRSRSKVNLMPSGENKVVKTVIDNWYCLEDIPLRKKDNIIECIGTSGQGCIGQGSNESCNTFISKLNTDKKFNSDLFNPELFGQKIKYYQKNGNCRDNICFNLSGQERPSYNYRVDSETGDFYDTIYSETGEESRKYFD